MSDPMNNQSTLIKGLAEAGRIVATYWVETPFPVERAVEVIAGEQSSGTFVSVPGETPELKQRYGARVENITLLDTVDAPSLPGSRPPRQKERPRYQRAE